ncbi:MAG: hypothetical protein KDB03_18185 [Planctomycetales bacterium]|nr:hypothetical protein [Planctomycetales bacterium]
MKRLCIKWLSAAILLSRILDSTVADAQNFSELELLPAHYSGIWVQSKPVATQSVLLTGTKVETQQTIGQLRQAVDANEFLVGVPTRIEVRPLVSTSTEPLQLQIASPQQPTPIQAGSPKPEPQMQAVALPVDPPARLVVPGVQPKSSTADEPSARPSNLVRPQSRAQNQVPRPVSEDARTDQGVQSNQPRGEVQRRQVTDRPPQPQRIQSAREGDSRAPAAEQPRSASERSRDDQPQNSSRADAQRPNNDRPPAVRGPIARDAHVAPAPPHPRAEDARRGPPEPPAIHRDRALPPILMHRILNSQQRDEEDEDDEELEEALEELNEFMESELVQSILKLKIENVELQAERELLRAKAEMQAEMAELRALTQVKQLEMRATMLEERLHEVMLQRERVAEANPEIHELQMALHNSNREREEISNQLREAREMIERLTADNHILKDEMLDQRRELEGARNRLHEAELREREMEERARNQKLELEKNLRQREEAIRSLDGAAREKAKQEAALDKSAIDWARRQIEKYDKNNDRKLTANEWEKMLIKPDGADANGDGEITLEEYAAFRAKK